MQYLYKFHYKISGVNHIAEIINVTRWKNSFSYPEKVEVNLLCINIFFLVYTRE